MPRAFEHVHGALHVDRHVFERPLDRGHDVADAGEMKHVVDVAKQRVAGLIFENVGRFENDVGIAGVVGDVGLAAADQIVDDADAVAAFDQEVDHVAADEAGAAGDDRGLARRAHFAPSFFMVRTL